ncbi:MAG TPA: MlaD family protein [Solirubrobacteraceae bacterium]|nr:MlaD family protein [Solirubrobacteraceae bacterium]
MKRAIKTHLTDFIAVIGLIAIASVVSYYILQNQRLRIPILEDTPYVLHGEFATGQAVTPGQGQTIRISGVRIGDISKVRLRNGRAIITMDIDREHAGLVKKDWHALLRPKTGLKDMFIEMMPPRGGSKAGPAPEGFTLPIANTLPDVNPDEFLSSLDRDTRDYLKLLLDGAAKGLDGRAKDLNHVLKRFEPTYRDLGAVQNEVAKRREDLKRLVHALDELNTELGRKDDDLAQLVTASARVFDAFARERDNVASTVRELPSTLATATDALQRVERMADVLGPASERLIPVAGALQRANTATRPFALEAAPQLRKDIRPFVRELRPLVRQLRPATKSLVEADPALVRSVQGLNTLFNLLAFNSKGREGPEVEDRDEGYLFYFAWVVHQSTSIFGGQDANGVFRPFVLGGTCNMFRNTAQSFPGAEFALGLTGILEDERVCGGPID